MTSLIHPSSTVSKSVQIGENVKIGPFCNLEGNIIIGDGQVPEGTYYYVIDLGENNSFGNNFIKGYVYIRRN